MKTKKPVFGACRHCHVSSLALQAILRGCTASQAVIESIPRMHVGLLDLMFAAALLLTAVVTTSPESASICLAYYDAGRIIMRALQCRSCVWDNGIRINLLASAKCLASLDAAAVNQLLGYGFFATIEQCLHVCPFVNRRTSAVANLMHRACWFACCSFLGCHLAQLQTGACKSKE